MSTNDINNNYVEVDTPWWLTEWRLDHQLTYPLSMTAVIDNDPIEEDPNE